MYVIWLPKDHNQPLEIFRIYVLGFQQRDLLCPLRRVEIRTEREMLFYWRASDPRKTRALFGVEAGRQCWGWVRLGGGFCARQRQPCMVLCLYKLENFSTLALQKNRESPTFLLSSWWIQFLHRYFWIFIQQSKKRHCDSIDVLMSSVPHQWTAQRCKSDISLTAVRAIGRNCVHGHARNFSNLLHSSSWNIHDRLWRSLMANERRVCVTGNPRWNPWFGSGQSTALLGPIRYNHVQFTSVSVGHWASQRSASCAASFPLITD